MFFECIFSHLSVTAWGSCDPPTEPPNGFASRTFGPPGRQIRKVCIFAPQKWGGLLFLTMILLRKNTPRTGEAGPADYDQGEESP